MADQGQPSGTVTLVFTDIEGSTKLLAELGTSGYREALGAHRRLVREAFARYRGYEVDYEGDSFFYAFASTADGLSAVSEVVAALEQGPIRIRVGIHSGEPELDPPKYVGADVHKAARIMAAAHGGQVLVSNATRHLVGDRVRLLDLGEHRLRDFQAPERLFQLGAGEHPPLRTLERTNLPVPATVFLGREAELSRVVDLLGKARLVTLTGPGGTGKTRLALRAAEEVSAAFPDGVWWIPLAALRDPALVLAEVAQTLGLDGEPGFEVGAALGGALGGRRTLLLLDNAEHLLPGAAGSIAALARVSGPSLLVTSRERLQLAGEHMYAVPPLSADQGVELFAARARALDPGFVADARLAELCERLDNLPLALELAAARTAVISPEQILSRISARLDLLKGGRDIDARQRTLRSTIAWSYELLDHEERELYAALSIFDDGCTLEAAETVCSADIDTLASLVDKSLVRVSADRYWMLQTIREYASERLAETARGDELRQGHAEYYERLASEGEVAVRTTAQAHWLELLRFEQPNVRLAIQWSLDRGQPDRALRTASALYRFWGGATAAEGRIWLERTLATGAGTDAERAKGLFVAGQLALLHGDQTKAVELLEQATGAARRAGERDVLVTSLGWLGWALYENGRPTEALDRLAECRELLASGLDPAVLAEALTAVGAVEGLTGNLGAADQLFREVLEIEQAVGDELSVADAYNNIGFTAWETGDLAEARRCLEECLAIAARRGDDLRLTMAVGNLGLVALSEERYPESISLLSEELRLSNRRANARSAAEALKGLSGACAGIGESALAIKLGAAHRVLCDSKGLTLDANRSLERTVEPLLIAARGKLAPPELAAAEKEGRALTPELALALVIASRSVE